MGYSPNITGASFVVTIKCLEVLKKYLRSFKAYPIKFTNSSIDPVFLFCYHSTGFDEINFTESILYTGGMIFGKKYHTINDIHEFKSFAKENPLFSFEKITLKKNADQHMIWPPVGRVYVSTILKEAILASGLTGLDFQPKNAPTLIVPNLPLF